MEAWDPVVILLSVYGVGNLALLTGIFFRLGTSQARIEDILRRIGLLERRKEPRDHASI